MVSAREANMNMIRSWGGGYYESEAFFDLADELGLMIWQDFMFGGGMQPAYDPAFRANVVVEAREQVQRLRHHPSLVLWCGNNEQEIAWKYWGHGRDMKAADPALAERVWQGYVQLFGRDLRQQWVAEEGGGIAYWSSSPGDDLAEVANTPASGDMHLLGGLGQPGPPGQQVPGDHTALHVRVRPAGLAGAGHGGCVCAAQRAGDPRAADHRAPEVHGRPGQ